MARMGFVKHLALLTSLCSLLSLSPAMAESAAPAATAATQAGNLAIGAPAPDFTLKDLDGKSVKLSDLKGKTVVLEWFNPDCPFVVYAHEKGPLKTLPEQYLKKGVVWLAINSGAPGKQGHGAEANKAGKNRYGMTYQVLLDETGTVGKLYGAKTTPHMFVVDAQGVLRYKGGLDNAPLGEPNGGTLIPHAANAIDALLGGKNVETSDTKPYGCGVKYGS